VFFIVCYFKGLDGIDAIDTIYSINTIVTIDKIYCKDNMPRSEMQVFGIFYFFGGG
jgi:hypothetical protein